MKPESFAGGLRTSFPQAYPQHPFNSPPDSRELSVPKYAIRADTDQMIAVRDGVQLALDVFRPVAPAGARFPALVGFGPYTRQLQQTDVPMGHNEAGIKEFWVPRGYAMVFVDVRGTNGSEGLWDMYGDIEAADLVDVIEWIAEQSWCTGSIGTTGQSYYSRTALRAATLRPPSLKAVFAYDAATDSYRDTFFHGGIPSEGMQRRWLGSVRSLNTRSGRATPEQRRAFEERTHDVVGLRNPLDGPYWQSRSAGPGLPAIHIPVYFGVRWSFASLHLRGAFLGWQGTGNIPKRMFIGPDPQPNAPHATYHLEALRWYDHWLKDLDTGVMDGEPIQLWIPGLDEWRSESEWPLARTEWRKLYLGGFEESGSGSLTWEANDAAESSWTVEPGSEDWLWGRPKMIYRTAPFADAVEMTGPLQLDLRLASDAHDADIFVLLLDEAPDGSTRLLTRGWLRASHREVDHQKCRVNQPWHPHKSLAPLQPGEPVVLNIEIIPNSNVYHIGHRLRLEIAGSDSMPENSEMYHRGHLHRCTNTIFYGEETVLHVPFIPK